MNYQEDSVIVLDCFGVLITKGTSSEQLFQYCFRKNIELLDYLKHLHTQEVKLSILSNTDRKTLRKYFTNEELDLFDSIFISPSTKNIRNCNKKQYRLHSELEGFSSGCTCLFSNTYDNCIGDTVSYIRKK